MQRVCEDGKDDGSATHQEFDRGITCTFWIRFSQAIEPFFRANNIKSYSCIVEACKYNFPIGGGGVQDVVNSGLDGLCPCNNLDDGTGSDVDGKP
jgi:hypothetical protein